MFYRLRPVSALAVGVRDVGDMSVEEELPQANLTRTHLDDD